MSGTEVDVDRGTKDLAGAARPSVADLDAPPTPAGPSKARVLLDADDAPTAAQLEALAARGRVEVVRVDDGAVDLVLVDAERAGQAVARRGGGGPPVVLLATLRRLEAAVEALRGGADDLLVRPVTPAQLEAALDRARARRSAPRPAGPPRRLECLERDEILRALEATGGNRARAAALLGVSVRTLFNRLREYRARGLHVVDPRRASA